MEPSENIDILQQYVHILENSSDSYDSLLTYIGNASIVLLGEATHGTHEFYEARIAITKRLVKEKGFTCLAIEGDWPDAFRVNQYIRHGTDKNALDALADFKRFPSWMWRNHEVARFIDWLHTHNMNQSVARKVGFYGLDVYGLHRSMQIVIEQLEKIDPLSAQKARERYACFDSFMDPQQYGRQATLFPSKSCRQMVMDQLIDLRKKSNNFYQKTDTLDAIERQLYIEQNALVVANAEEYYRSLFEGNPAHSWNIRDEHMAQTVDILLNFITHYGAEQKIIIWAHNSHVGDARATEMALRGEINIGQLMRERYASKVKSIGFSTYTGTVSAASSWSGVVERKSVRPALPGSYEALFHELGFEKFLLFPHQDEKIYELLAYERLQRAIGVIYMPHTERLSHYYHASLPKQFDVMIHFDTTRALEPLEKSVEWVQGEMPDTYPFGI